MEGKEQQFEIRDNRIKERFYLDDLYLNGYAKKCGIYATGVYLSLCRHSNKNQISWPSRKRIAEELLISEKQVGRALNILEENRLILRERMGKKLNNRYILLDKSEWTDSPITRDSQAHHIGTDRPIHSKETQVKETHSKDIDAIDGIIHIFKEKIRPVKVTALAKQSVARMLNKFSFDDIVKVIEDKSGNQWYMDNNAKRGMSWFFEKQVRFQKWLEEIAEEEGIIVPKDVAVEIDGNNGSGRTVALVKPENLEKFMEQNKQLNPTRIII